MKKTERQRLLFEYEADLARSDELCQVLLQHDLLEPFVMQAVRKGSEHTEVGGEKQVCTFDEGQYVNVGPWRIPYSHTAVLDYCRELGVPVQVFLNDSDANYFFYEGTAAGALSNKKIRVREVKADLTGAINELLVKAID